MKKSLLLIALMIISFGALFAQVPQAFKYQGVARNASGNTLNNSALTVRIIIHDNTSTGPIVYQESHAVTTNSFGLYSLNVGQGTVQSGTFAAITWSLGSKFMEQEVNFGSGFVSMGSSQLLSVPFALYAANGAAGPQGPAGPTGPTGPTGPQGPAGPAGTSWSLTAPSFNTAGQVIVNGTAGSNGPVTSTQAAWLNSGNALSATGIFGTTSNNHIDILSNNVARGRIENGGRFLWGATTTTFTSDNALFNSTATYPYAISGISNFASGAGVYGLAQASSNMPGVYGEYGGSTAFNTYGMVGANLVNASAGTGFFIAAGSGPQIGVRGAHFGTVGSYKFGVYGDFSSTAIRCGAVFGDDFGIAMGALGYYAANLVDYGVYGFGSAYATGVTTGKMVNNNETGVGLNEPNTNIGLGIYGGVMGGWVRGLQYGFHAKGNRYGLYVDGVTFTNKPVAQLIDAGAATRTAVYANNSTTSDVYAKGKAILVNGTATIMFDEKFKSLIDNPDELVITVTPNGNTNGVYVASVNSNGFTIVENNGGNRSDVTVSWIAATEIKQNKNLEIPAEVAADDFDSKMRGVMFNDNNKTDTPQPLWYDGTQIRFDQAPAKKTRTVVKEKSLSGNLSGRNTQ